MVPPSALAMIVCDSYYREPTTGKMSVLGSFGGIRVEEIPATIGQICVYAALTSARGELRVAVRIVDADEEEVIAPEQYIDLTFDGPLSALEFVVLFADVIFDDTGEYRVQLFAGKTLVVERRIGIGLISE